MTTCDEAIDQAAGASRAGSLRHPNRTRERLAVARDFREEVPVHVAEIWRYPVKSMAGERLEQAFVRSDGIAGDRIVHVSGPDGSILTARRHPRLLGHRATLDASREPLVDGRPWGSPAVLADVRRIAGPEARLVRDEHLARFDILPLLVATDGAIAMFGRDGRRLRPNIVVAGVTGHEERRWPGARLRIGEVELDVESLRRRCVMTTVDPDTLERDPEVLKDIVRRFGGRLALDCAVVRGGTIRVGQEALLLPPADAT